MNGCKETQVFLEDMMPLIQERLATGQNVQFEPKGISMLPLLRPGTDSVVLSPISEKLKKYDISLYQRRNGRYVLHRIVEVGETYTCMGDNQLEKEPGLEQEQMIAVVTAFYRDGERHEVSEWSYQVYCRYWYYRRLLCKVWRYSKSRIKRKVYRIAGVEY
ncbi:MAG: S24/S26 family peptidase [Lachnospiraceae bacterium]|nr:S24/S26 family peptidase [Lachnospiraceae bacterium]